MKHLYLLPLLFLLGCGAAQRSCSSVTGKPSEICWEGVVYLQFPSGATVKVTPDGKPALCGQTSITST